MTNDGQTRQVTTEAEGIVCGQSVHRNEFGINKGTYWSPQGNLLAFYRMDESMVTQYPLVDITARIGELNNVRYPMAGMTSHKVTVGIYNTETQKTVYLNTGDPTDRYFTNISWAPDAKSIYLIELNRDQNHAKLCQYNAETGEPMGVLYEEMHPKYVEPQNPIVFLPWDPTKFIYQSQRDGYNHLYLFETNAANMKGETYNSANGGSYFQAGKVKQLTKGNWLVSEILGFNTKRKEVIFTAVEGLRSGHFAVNVSNGKISQPFENCKESEHSGTLSASGTYLIDRYSTKDQPRVINLVDTKNFKETANLLTAENPYDGYQMPSIETGTIKDKMTFDCDGYEDFNGQKVRCVARYGHGIETVRKTLMDSCNDAIMQMSYKIGKNHFTEYQSIYGFGQKTGIDLPGEANTASLMYQVEDMKPIDLATNAFGQNYNCTMVQMVSGFASLINGGTYYQPHLVTKITDSTGNTISTVEPKAVKQTISQSTSDKIRDYLQSVVKEGTGNTAKVDGYSMGGKTGTAQKFPRGNGKYLVSFMGFAPYDNPQVLIYVVVNEPNVADQPHSVFAQNIAREILEEVLPYMNIYPDEKKTGVNKGYDVTGSKDSSQYTGKHNGTKSRNEKKKKN